MNNTEKCTNRNGTSRDAEREAALDMFGHFAAGLLEAAETADLDADFIVTTLRHDLAIRLAAANAGADK